MNEENDLFKGLGIRVKLLVEFSKVREVLTRIGVANYKTKTLVQTAHIFHKRGEYALMHFKEMFIFDGKEADLVTEDENRLLRIATMLEEWGLIEILDSVDDIMADGITPAPINSINIITRKMAADEGWKLLHKYTLGKH